MPEAGEDYACAARWSNSEFCALLTLVIHFLHPLLCIINYLAWVQDQKADDRLGENRVDAYLALTILATLTFFLLSSVFYILAHRWPNPPLRATRRTSWGVFFNLMLSDLPIFILEVDMCWEVGWASGIQAFCMLVTIFSFVTSAVRSWLFFVGKFIETQEGVEEEEAEERLAQPPIEPNSPGALPDAYNQLDKDASAAAGGAGTSSRSGTSYNRPPGFFLPAHWLEEQHVIPVICGIVWFLATLVSLLNYMIYLRVSSDKGQDYGRLPPTYLAFVVISLIVYFTIATTMWLWSFRYSKARALRRQKTTTGILVMFFLSNVPLWSMDYRTVELHGVKEPTQLLSLLFQSTAWLLGAITLWLTYAKAVTSCMHKGQCCPGLYGNSRRRRASPPRQRYRDGLDTPGVHPSELMAPEYRWRAMFSFDPPPSSPSPARGGQFRMPEHVNRQPAQTAFLQSPEQPGIAPVHVRPTAFGQEELPSTFNTQPTVPQSPRHSAPGALSPVQPRTALDRGASPAVFSTGVYGQSPAMDNMQPILPPTGATVVRTPSTSPYSQAPTRAGGIIPEGPMQIGIVPGGASPSFGSPSPQRAQIYNDLV